MEDFIEYKRMRALARKTISRKKREDLQRFAASLNKNVNIKYVWRKIRTIKKSWNKVNWNKWQTKNRTKIIEESIDKLAPPWVNNKKSSISEKEIIKENKKFNQELTKEEFDRAIRYIRSKSSQGRDDIEYDMVKRLPEKYKEELLKK